jgi:hypothetical protein
VREFQVPDSLRFLVVVLILGGAAYGAVWGLSHFPPEQTEIVKSLPHEKLRAK